MAGERGVTLISLGLATEPILKGGLIEIRMRKMVRQSIIELFYIFFNL
jgi:hypothetical protein